MSDLPRRMRDAANTIEEVSALYGYRHPVEAGWSATELRHEAEHLDKNTPPTDFGACSGALADTGQEPA
jgi:hypothetical protein